MPRHEGSTYRVDRRKNRGHRAHKRTRLARLKARSGSGRKARAWGRGGNV
jgi:hypothetical protein